MVDKQLVDTVVKTQRQRRCRHIRDRYRPTHCVECGAKMRAPASRGTVRVKRGR